MKKDQQNSPIKKLVLKKETLQKLDDDKLRVVGGLQDVKCCAYGGTAIRSAETISAY